MSTEYAKSKQPGHSRPAKVNQPSKSTENYPRIHWGQVTFTPAQKATLREQALDVERSLDILASMVERGYKLVVNPKTSQGFVGFSIIGHTDECPDKGYGLSGEGGSFYASLKSLMAKLDILDYALRTEDIDGEDDFR